MFLERDEFNGLCGLAALRNFCVKLPPYSDYRAFEPARLIEGGAAGFAVAAFIENNVCRRMYKALKKRFKIVYQSPVRVNRNTNNKFFFVIYDTQE